MIDVCGEPMISRVVTNVAPSQSHTFVIVSQQHHDDLKSVLGDDDIAIHTGPTEGAIDTILKARHYASDEPLIICNCDQLARFSPDDFIESASGSDGAILTFRSSTPHHSYVQKDHTGRVTLIKEKEVISTEAVVGVYLFNCGRDFIRACEQVIRSNTRVNSEFYVSSAIARLVAEGKRFVTYNAPTAILGTPQELQLFEMAVDVAGSL